MKDLQDYYSQWKNNKSITLSKTGMTTFKDFVIWEEDILQSHKGISSKEFWLDAVKDNVSPIKLPYSTSEKEGEKFKGSNYSIKLEKGILDKLKKFSIKHYHSLYTIMLSAYSLLLKKYTEENVVMGIPMANRGEVDFEEVIGFFMNMTLFDNMVEDEDTFLSLVKRNENKLFDAMEHSYYPLHQLSMDTKKSKLFNTAFYYQNWVEEVEKINSENESFLGEPILEVHQQGEFDLTLEIIEMKENVDIYFKYNPTLYEQSIIERMAEHYVHLLNSVLDNPEHKLTSLHVLKQEELINSLLNRNNTKFDYDFTPTHELFEQAALMYSDSMAVSVGGNSMTYQDLNSYSNRLANLLKKRGVNHGDLVGVYLTRTPKLLASLLAIHKAGAAYVPLDPIYPNDRVHYMIEHSELEYIITESQLSKDVAIDGITPFLLDLDHKDIEKENTSVLNIQPTLMEDTAYVIYTSGSTGKPKGVEVLHKGLTNFLCYMKQALDIQPSEKFFSLTTICFDIAGLELFLPLISGASVEIGTDEDIRDGLAIKKVLEERSINVVQGTPSNWRMIREAGWLPDAQMKLLVGGERVDQDIKQFLTQQASKVWNVYGPTETTIWSTISSLTFNGPITIGRPIGNTQVYVLNSDLLPVPDGVKGDLYIAGDGLSKGYFKNPELTKNSFIPNPFIPRTTMYKTGDLARYLKSGEIEFIGRSDQQVKLRGYRLELGEIEAVLKTNQNVSEAVVVLRNNKQHVPQLVGFIQQEVDRGVEFIKELLQDLSKKLPGYMFPSKVITVKSFPLTLNQKIDRKVLRDLDEDIIRKKYEVKNDPGEQTSEGKKDNDLKLMIETSLIEMISITNEIDKLEIDVSLNIGEYGFDSISYTKLAQKISQQYEIDIKPNIFYQYSTIESFAHHLSTYYQEKLESLVLPVSEEKKVVRKPISQEKVTVSKNIPSTEEPIAIVGMWGKMPQSQDLDEFWDSLFNDRDLIEEVPASRWDWREFEGNPMTEGNKISSKWGGFIPNVDKFDPSFFGISPYEANSMDPQQRLILESVWKTIENSGHRLSELSGSSTGVFIGSSGSDFMGTVGDEVENYTLTGIARSVLANRVSYLLNLTGPSEPVDTACSSGLVAMHRAIAAIQSGECEQAIAGAVNVILDPFASIAASKVGMLSVDGRCKAFDSSANGYVRGEGVATVLLKPLSKALEEHDYIYGVVRSSAVNHGGKANSFTAPNPNAQTDLLIKAYQKANINPSMVSYIEAHGTGTELGDPIEIDGLKAAFNQLYKEWGIEIPSEPHCGIGSVKSNIGHLEAAAGMAGLIKILLCMQHEVLPSNIHLKEKNPYIDLDHSPFYLVREKEEWRSMKDDKQNNFIAGVSSFGFGGSNAHIVLQEYEHTVEENDGEKSYIIPLAAKTDEELKEVAINLRGFLLKEKPIKQKTLYNLTNISYTLQVGRDGMKSRFSTVVSSEKELLKKLDEFLIGSKDKGQFYNHTIKKRKPHPDLLEQQEIDDLVQNKRLKEIAYQWVIGNSIDWNELHKDDTHQIQRVPLPSYPFKGESFPIHNKKGQESVKHSKPIEQKHPMLEKSDMVTDNICEVSLTGNEYFIRDHVVDQQRVMPGVAYLEMSLAAAKRSFPNYKVNLIKNIVWSKPLIIGENFDEKVEIHLEETKQSDLSYSFISKGNVLSGGKLAFRQPLEEVSPVNLPAIKERCSYQKSTEDCYRLFRKNDFKYGPSFQVIETIHHSNSESLALINMPGECSQIKDYTLHPSLMDGALQNIILLLGERDNQELILPFSIGEIQIHRPLVEKCYVYGVLKNSKGQVRKYDIYLTDLSGNVLVYIKDYSLRMVKAPEKKKLNPIHFYEPSWIESSIHMGQGLYEEKEVEIIFDNNPSRYAEWIKNENVLLVKTGDSFRIEGPMLYSINPMNDKDYALLLKEIRTQLTYLPNKMSIFWPLSSVELTVGQKFSHSAEAVFSLVKTLMTQGVNQADITYVYDCASKDQNTVFDQAIGGLAKTIVIEKPNILVRAVGIDSIYKTANQLHELVRQERAEGSKEVRYLEGKRYVKSIVKARVENQLLKGTEPIFKDEGVYVISGGAGAIGLFLAKSIVQQAKNPYLYLLGRSELSKELKGQLEYLEKLGASVRYLQTDVSKSKEVHRAFEIIKEQHECIKGIFHAAGMIKDSYLLKKSLEDFRQVIQPKVFGTINIEDAIKDFDVDLFVLFSSISSITGNIGQSDYAYANSYLNEFAVWRENKPDKKGKTISISWPLWQNGGMKVESRVTEMLEKKWGVAPLSNEHAIRTINIAVKQTMNQLIPLEGDGMKIDEVLQVRNIEETNKSIEVSETSEDSEFNLQELQELTIEYLKEVISKATEVPGYKIDEEEPFEVYGIDSVMILKLNTELETIFGDISKTLFFEYQNTAELADYFIEYHSAQLIELLGLTNNEDPVANHTELVYQEDNFEDQEIITEPQLEELPKLEVEKYKESTTKEHIPAVNHHVFEDDIAIVGIDGQYPKAKNLEEFWENLQEGKNCITEIPSDRWDYKKYFTEQKGERGKTYSKWGGFLEDVDKFDPLFFNISPLEAQMLDPQERLFIQTVWHTLEDAGYTRKKLADKNVGVYVGAMWGQYQLYGGEIEEGIIVTPTSSYASIANRVSYFFNFNGPSLTLDTMCSSSLTTIHLACESIRNGEIDMAIAGGVNLTIHPNKHIFLSQTKFASSEGLCKSFGEGGDGYVPGEGVGAVLLKPLKKAIEDNDRIYSVIKGTVVNHGGKTNGYTVPNPKAQENLIEKALAKTGIDPRTISYIEAHGTGTALGDPIEITGISKAFGKYTKDKNFCSIGSVKSNIGHCESAAGIAGITKMVLQLKHKKLVPSIHSDVLNSNINFEETPFYVQQKFEDWKQPVLVKDGREIRMPRRAGISSFGAGGANAHIILEEYEPSIVEESKVDSSPQLLVLSAKNKEQLNEYAKSLVEFLSQGQDNMREFVLSQLSGEQNQKVQAIPDFREAILKELSDVLAVSPSDLDIYTSFDEYGMGHVELKALINLFKDEYNITLDINLEENVFSVMEKVNPSIKVERHSNTIPFTDIAYTLQTGREEMEERLAIVASSSEEAVEKLLEYCNGNESNTKFNHNNINQSFGKTDFLFTGKEGKRFINDLILNKQLDKLAHLWVSGIDIAWDLLHDGLPKMNVTAPKYPFAKERCWVTDDFPLMKQSARIHPLVHEVDANLSLTKGGVVYKTFLTDEMKERLANSYSYGVMILEVIKATLEQISENMRIQELELTQKDFVSGEDIPLYIHLENKDELLRFNVSVGEEEKVLARGVAKYDERMSDDGPLPVTDLLTKVQSGISRTFSQGGLIFECKYNDQEMVIEWKNNVTHRDYFYDSTLVAEVLKVLEKCFDVKVDEGIKAINSVSTLHEFGTEGVVFVQKDQEDFFNIAFLTYSGDICAKWEGCSYKGNSNLVLDRFFYKPFWKKAEVAVKPQQENKKVLIIQPEGFEELITELKNNHVHDVVYITKPSTRTYPLTNEIWEFDGTLEGTALLLKEIQDIDVIYFLGGLSQSLEVDSTDMVRFTEIQDKGVIQLYRIVKAIETSLPNKKVQLKVVTNNVQILSKDEVNYPYSASLVGFSKSLAKEYKNITVSCMDIALENSHKDNALMIAAEETSTRVKEVAFRQGRRYERILLPEELSVNSNPAYKKNGVYFIVGGMGNVGHKLSLYLAENYKAKLVITGRTALNDQLREKIKVIEEKGGEVLYIQADLMDREGMGGAVKQAIHHYGKINGVIHSAMNFAYEIISNTNEEKLKEEIGSKAIGSLILFNALKNLDLDFLLFFSSGEAFTGNVGWSSYAAGCTFKDAFASHISSRVSYPVQIINWGFWDNEQDEFKGMLKSKGIHPIETNIGMKALERVLSHQTKQVMALNVEDNVLTLMGVELPKVNTSTSNWNAFNKALSGGKQTKDISANPVERVPMTLDKDALQQKVELFVKEIFSRVLKLDVEKIENHKEFSFYGVDSLIVTDIHQEFEKELDEKLLVTLLLENTTVADVTEYLIENNSEALIRKFGGSTIERIESQPMPFSEVEINLFNQVSHEPGATEESLVPHNVLTDEVYVSTSMLSNPDIEILSVTEQSEVSEMLYEYGDKYTNGTLKAIKDHIINKSDMVYNPNNMYHMMINTSFNKKIEVFTIGEGVPILLVPAIGLTAPIWTNQLKGWSDKYQLIVIHHPGYGISEVPKQITHEVVAAIFKEVLQTLEIERKIHIIGSCFGGVVSQYFAKEYPELVASLTLAGSFYKNFGLPDIQVEDLTIEQMIEGASMISTGVNRDFDVVLENTELDRDSRLDVVENARELLNKSQCVDPLVVMRYITQILTLSGKEWLADINIPTLCLAGDLDTIVSPIISQEISELVPDGTYMEIKGSGHYPYLTHTEDFDKRVLPFIEKQENIVLV
ncbi:amino acid adenylation domain-containing protein [Peribacillus phoenicis]